MERSMDYRRGAHAPRTAAKKDGALAGLHPQELMAQTLNAIKERNHIDPREVDDVVVGSCVTAYGDQADVYRAGMSVLAAEWPNDSTGVTINRFCGSGQQAVNFAAMGVKAGGNKIWWLPAASNQCRGCRWTPIAAVSTATIPICANSISVPQGISADLIAAIEGSRARIATASRWKASAA